VTDPDPDPVQEQLIALRRRQILAAATRVFAEKGFHRATIRDVAQAAGIADGTIYNYFKNKDAVLLGILDQLNETPERAGQFAQASNLGLEAWVSQYIQQRFTTIGPEGRQLLRVVLAEALGNRELRETYFEQIIEPTYRLGEGFFRQWIADGSVRPVDPALTLRLTAAMFLGVLMLQLMGDPLLTAREDEVAGAMADIILHGLKKEQPA